MTRKDFLKGTGAAALGVLLPRSASQLFPPRRCPISPPATWRARTKLWSWLEKLAG
jgi:hypothetical protein